MRKMLRITPVLQYNDSPATSITCIPIGIAHKPGHLKAFETIIEGMKDVRMQCRKRENLKNLTKKSRTSKVLLKENNAEKNGISNQLTEHSSTGG